MTSAPIYKIAFRDTHILFVPLTGYCETRHRATSADSCQTRDMGHDLSSVASVA